MGIKFNVFVDKEKVKSNWRRFKKGGFWKTVTRFTNFIFLNMAMGFSMIMGCYLALWVVNNLIFKG